jgi:hAT family C-terminal dimerisation region
LLPTDEDNDDEANGDEERLRALVVEAKRIHDDRLCQAVKLLRALMTSLTPAQRAKYKDPATFWQEINVSVNPRLQQIELLRPLARSLLAAPTTSASSESLFSVTGALKSSIRASLSSEALRAEALISRNLHLFPSRDDFLRAVVDHLLSRGYPKRRRLG